jgi:hypothetical protein
MRLTTGRSWRRVQQSLAAGPCQFYLLVLAVPPGSSHIFWGPIAAGEGLGAQDRPERGTGLAVGQPPARPRAGPPGKLGANADGEAGEPHPLRAIREVLAKHPADEIILATAPHRVTRLLAMDLQHRLHRTFGVPVTVLGSTRADRQDRSS